MSPSALFVTTVPITLKVFLVPFARQFRAHGWRVDALANGAASFPGLAAEFDALYDAPWSRNPLAPRNIIGSPSTVRSVVRAGRYDLVHVHTPVAAFVSRWAIHNMPHETRPVVIYTAHGFHFYEGQARLPHAVYRSMERIAAPWTDYLVTINAQDERAAHALGGIPDERIRLIPGVGVDLAAYAETDKIHNDAAQLREELGISQADFMLTMIAEFGAVKRHEHLVRGLERIRNERVVVVFVGDGPLENRTRALVDALGLGAHVRFAGYRTDIPTVLAASDALTLVSEREGLPRSVLEAMAAGRPVIGTDTRGIADAVGSQAGWIVPKHNVDALAAAIDAAAGDPAEVERRGAAARARAEREFALDRIVQRYEELYDEALSSRL